MPDLDGFALGEFHRALDERYRLSIPAELASLVAGEGEDCILAKERAGCLSLWNSKIWQAKLDAGVDLVKAKIRAGKLEGRWGQVQMFGRLLSSRNVTVQLAGRTRLIVPDGFRQFLQVEAGNDVVILGAAICIEIWNPSKFHEYLETRMPKFRKLFERLSH